MLHLTRVPDAGALLDLAGGFLLRHEAEHNLLLGICANLVAQTLDVADDPYFAVVTEGTTTSEDTIRLVALMTPPHNVVVSRCADLASLDLLIAGLHAEGRAAPGVIGPPEVAGAFAERWTALGGQGFHVSTAERIYEITTVRPAPRVPGRLRRAVEADFTLLADWLAAFRVEAMCDTPDPAAAERAARLYLQADPASRGMFVWEDGAPEARPVSMAGYTGPTRTGIRVGPVYTPPELRRRGYATACVAAVSQRLLDSGRQRVFLFTNLANPVSNHIYQEIGYRPVCDISEIAFDSQA